LRVTDLAPTLRGSRAALIAVVAAAPAVATFALIQLFLKAQVNDFVPSVWNDQTSYWHEILSFSKAGFNSGYYGPNEHTAAIGGLHLGVESPVFPVGYGTIASLVGWSLDTSIFFNLMALGLGIIAFCLLTGLDRRQIALVGLVCLTFGPILLYLPTSSQESANQAVAMVLAAIVCVLIAGEGQVSRPVLAAVVSLAVAASLLRYSWAILLVAILVLALPHWSTSTLIRRIAAGCLITVGVLAVVAATTVPGGTAPFDRILKVSVDPVGGVRDLFGYTSSNLRTFLQAGGVTGLLAVQIAAVLAISTAMLAVGRASSVGRREWTFHFFNFGATVLACLVLYLPLGYYRLIGAHLLLSLLVMVRFKHYLVVVAMALTMLAAGPLLLIEYKNWGPNFGFDHSELSAERAQMQELVHYDANARSPWCNTLLIPIWLYDWRVTLIPAGIGVSYISYRDGPPLELPVKSRYLMLDVDPSEGDPVDISSLHELGTFSFGRLFENPASVCFKGQA
jgi:hypothetical protein